MATNGPRQMIRRVAWVLAGTIPALVALTVVSTIRVDPTSVAKLFLTLFYFGLAILTVASLTTGILWKTSGTKETGWATLQVVLTYSSLWSIFAFALGEASLSNVWWKAALGLLYVPFVGLGLPFTLPIVATGVGSAWAIHLVRRRQKLGNQAPLAA